MLDKCLEKEESHDQYDPKVFNEGKMKEFLDKARAIIPEIIELRDTLQPFSFGARPHTS